MSTRTLIRSAGLPAIALTLIFGWLTLAARAEAAPDIKKAIWGPPENFADYQNLGTGIYQYGMNWWKVAQTEPTDPTNPASLNAQGQPAYHWPEELDTAIAQAQSLGIEVSVMVLYTPGWANGGKQQNDAPTYPQAYANFVKAASLKYPYVKYWQIWGEPSRRRNFRPMGKVNSDRPLTESEKRGPRLYARILNASYKALKSVDPSDLVIGGNTLTRGDVRPLRFIQALRLPSGKPPKMDLYGHNPFSFRKPDLTKDPLAYTTADFCDLDTLAGWIDDNLGRNPQGNRLRIFVAEYTLPSDHANYVFPWWGNRQDQAAYLRAGLKIARSYGRVYTMGWWTLHDQAPNGNGDEVNWGLIDHQGDRKPAYYAYKNN